MMDKFFDIEVKVEPPTLRQAAHQALEALDWMRLHLQRDHQCLHMDPAQSGIPAWINKAEITLRAALAEPVQEPVATITECEACFTPDVCQLRGTCDHYAAERLRVAAPPQREPLTEEQVDRAYQEIWRDSPDDFGPTAGDWIEAGIRYAERAHGIIEPGIKVDK